LAGLGVRGFRLAGLFAFAAGLAVVLALGFAAAFALAGVLVVAFFGFAAGFAFDFAVGASEARKRLLRAARRSS
tara:strand:- start:27 stop:248 length:222 start_codon:yes stop_codon:yes gene_type:complete